MSVAVAAVDIPPMATDTPKSGESPTDTEPMMAEVRTYEPSKLAVTTCPVVEITAALRVVVNVASEA